MKRGRIIAAFLLSPFAGALYLLVLTLLNNGQLKRDLRDPVGMIAVVLFFAIIGYVAELTLGILLLILFRGRGLLSLPWFLLGGFAIGISVWVVVEIYLFDFFRGPPNPFTFGLIYCIAPAIISTAAFWFLGGSADNQRLPLAAR